MLPACSSALTRNWYRAMMWGWKRCFLSVVFPSSYNWRRYSLSKLISMVYQLESTLQRYAYFRYSTVKVEIFFLKFPVFQSCQRTRTPSAIANHACMNLQIAEAQPLFCKERFIFISFIFGKLENKRPALLHDGERGGTKRNEMLRLSFLSQSV